MSASRGGTDPPAVLMRGITRAFGAVLANDHVDLTVASGTVHGIVGENGAGKSTLMSILYGLLRADAGSIAIHGAPTRIGSAREAIARGIGMVHQHFMLVDTLSALDNALLGVEPDWRLGPARARLRGQLETLMHATGLQVRLDRPVEDLPVGERQRLEILKALARGARILILDEPTAVLTPHETGQLFATLGRLRAQGTTIVLITHKLNEIIALCDAVTVMRAGRVVFDGPIAGTRVDALAEAMVGRRVPPVRAAPARAGARRETGGGAGRADPVEPHAAVLLQARDLHWRDGLGVVRLAGVALQLRAGEIVGVAGVAGNGQSELLDILAGLLAPGQGSLAVGGGADTARFTPGRWLDPARARALGIGHVPEDRHRRGLVLPFAAWESAVVGLHPLRHFSSAWGRMKHAAMRRATARMMDDYDVRPRDTGLRSARFSGGNQQKLVLAREAFTAPRILLAGQPTRGVDIGAIEFIHARLRAMRDAGSAVLLVSSELDEILALADRVLVMDRGRIAGELPIGQATQAALGKLMAGASATGA